MAEALILDSEALNALANPSQRGVLFERARAILQVAYEKRARVRVPAPVLTETCRTTRYDAAINRLLDGRGILVLDLSRVVAQRAGHLLARVGLASAHAVDAMVVSSAMAFERAVIATGDPRDMSHLVGSQSHVRVFPLS